ncbi:MAG: hypothetical protein ACK4N5_04670 [Myxococcales bacterium]
MNALLFDAVSDRVVEIRGSRRELRHRVTRTPGHLGASADLLGTVPLHVDEVHGRVDEVRIHVDEVGDQVDEVRHRVDEVRSPAHAIPPSLT